MRNPNKSNQLGTTDIPVLQIKMKLTDKIFLKVIFGISIFSLLSGVCGISFGIYQLSVSNSKPEWIRLRFREIHTFLMNGTNNIVLGCWEIAIGICGICASVFKKRVQLLTHIILVALGFIANFTTVILLEVKQHSSIEQMKLSAKYLITTEYGLSQALNVPNITSQVDQFQTDFNCCGWSSLGGDNLFLDSPWHRDKLSELKSATNQIGDSLSNHSNSKIVPPPVLPDSCCRVELKLCHGVSDIMMARKEGIVKKYDCLEEVTHHWLNWNMLSVNWLIMAFVVKVLTGMFYALCLNMEIFKDPFASGFLITKK